MSLVFENALMPSEDQQALRLRLVYLMRRFLLLALGMGLLLPTAVNAENSSHHLLIYVQGSEWNVPMKSMAACEKALEKALVMDNWKHIPRNFKPLGGRGLCLENK